MLSHFTLRNPYLDISPVNVSWNYFSTSAVFLATQNRRLLCRIRRRRLGQVVSNKISEPELFWRSPRENSPWASERGKGHGAFLSWSPWGSYWEVVTIKTRLRMWLPWHPWLNCFGWSLIQDIRLCDSKAGPLPHPQPGLLPWRFSAKNLCTVGN